MFEDTYLVSADGDTLANFCTTFQNAIGPSRGRIAIAESLDEEGQIVPAQEAAGDPTFFYACVRLSTPIEPPDGIALCDEETGKQVLGFWA